jgi:hypothetical protein
VRKICPKFSRRNQMALTLTTLLRKETLHFTFLLHLEKSLKKLESPSRRVLA